MIPDNHRRIREAPAQEGHASAEPMTHFELWSIRRSNLLGSWETRDQALRAVHRILVGAPNLTDDLALHEVDDDEDGDVVADGKQLADMAAQLVSRGRVPT